MEKNNFGKLKIVSISLTSLDFMNIIEDKDKNFIKCEKICLNKNDSILKILKNINNKILDEIKIFGIRNINKSLLDNDCKKNMDLDILTKKKFEIRENILKEKHLKKMNSNKKKLNYNRIKLNSIEKINPSIIKLKSINFDENKIKRIVNYRLNKKAIYNNLQTEKKLNSIKNHFKETKFSNIEKKFLIKSLETNKNRKFKDKINLKSSRNYQKVKNFYKSKKYSLQVQLKHLPKIKNNSLKINQKLNNSLKRKKNNKFFLERRKLGLKNLKISCDFGKKFKKETSKNNSENKENLSLKIRYINYLKSNDEKKLKKNLIKCKLKKLEYYLQKNQKSEEDQDLKSIKYIFNDIEIDLKKNISQKEKPLLKLIRAKINLLKKFNY